MESAVVALRVRFFFGAFGGGWSRGLRFVRGLNCMAEEDEDVKEDEGLEAS